MQPLCRNRLFCKLVNKLTRLSSSCHKKGLLFLDRGIFRKIPLKFDTNVTEMEESMKDEHNFKVIGTTLSAETAFLENEFRESKKAMEAEIKAQIRKAQKKLLELAEEPEKLSTKDRKIKQKRDRWVVGTATFAGACVGAAALAIALLFPPAALLASTYITPLIGSAISTEIMMIALGSAAATAMTAAGYGAGLLQAKFTPYIPKLSAEQITEIKEKAKETVEADVMNKLLCKLRLNRTEGKLSYHAFAEVCEALADISQLKYKIPESALDKLKHSAQQAREHSKVENEQQREREKLELEKKKLEKEEARNELKEKLTLRKIEQDMDIDKLLAAAKIQRGGGDNPLEDILANFLSGGNGSLAQVAKMFSGKNARAAA